MLDGGSPMSNLRNDHVVCHDPFMTAKELFFHSVIVSSN